MFTNWLTGSSSNSTAATRSASSSASSSGMGGAGSASALVMSSPPDVILEVGPAPSSVRFVAHSLVLGMHSGYLRSAIRLDEASASSAIPASSPNNSSTTSTGELLLYLSNVTADQFAPLLTYMYTGYLDLTVDNIFAVLLATHVLHMPRALEICRSFLARAQTEGYLNGNPQAQLCPAIPGLQAAKVIRPIPSKATMPNFGFLPMPSAHPPPPPPSHPPPPPASVAPSASLSSFMDNEQHSVSMQDIDEEDEDVEVFIDSNTVTDNEADPEPVDVDMECNVSVVSSLAGSSAGSLNIERLDVKPPTPVPVSQTIIIAPKQTHNLQAKNPIQSKRESKGRGGKSRSRKTTGLQVAKAPVPAAQLELASTATPITPSKFIIDVASCDGPVRFRRILNTAYGHKPESQELGSSVGPGGSSVGGGAGGGGSSAQEQLRSQQSVSYSFHQQMARAISSQQRQLSHQQQEESENSGDGGGGGRQPAARGATASSSSGNRKPPQAAAAAAASSTSTAGNQQQELYVCVYCKHTFKSQYCYQKHAKRHLNPLSLTTTTATASADKKLLAGEPTAAVGSLEMDSSNLQQQQQQQQQLQQQHQQGGNSNATTEQQTTGATAALLRREVRPLDMNVQYYPCKTCGSKFPSYYFVHKHRKMCHADEIEATATSNNNSSSSGSSNNSSSNISSTNNTKRNEATATEGATTTTTTTTTADDQQAQS